MTGQSTLTTLVLDHVVEQTRDYRQVLADIAHRVEPFTPEVVQAFTQAYREARVRAPLPPDDVIQAIQSAAVALLFGGLKAGDLREYFTDFAAWGEQIALSGLSYDGALKLLREYQRSGVPFLVRAYPTGFELEAAFNAIDQLYGAMAAIIAATYIQSAQGQLIYGARSRALGQLATGVSHALQASLTSIVGRAQLMSERSRDVESRGELDAIRRAASIGAETARQLQEFASAGEDESLVLSDVNTLLTQAADMTRFAWRDREESEGYILDIVKDFAQMPPISVRPGEIRAAFIELIINAVEAMPQGGVITLRTERKGDQVFASVIDKGSGMDEATRLRVFDPFFTTKSPPHPGLGLSTAMQIITQHAGTLTAESEAGNGAIFTVGLPVADKVEQPSAQPETPQQSAAILFIDDDATERDLAKKFLMVHGYSVDTAEDGNDGMSQIRRRFYDLVFADLGMPGMSGWQIAEKIRQFHPRTLIVLMTPWAVALNSEKIKASGAHRVVRKPLELDKLLALVQEAVMLKEKM